MTRAHNPRRRAEPFQRRHRLCAKESSRAARATARRHRRDSIRRLQAMNDLPVVMQLRARMAAVEAIDPEEPIIARPPLRMSPTLAIALGIVVGSLAVALAYLAVIL